MKILLYGINFAPELIGIGKYTSELAARLAARGHEVRVVTTPPYYPAWVVGPGYSGKTYRTEQWQGVRLYRCPLWVPHHPGGLKRVLHLASFAVSSLPVMLRQVVWRPDLVWVVEPALFCAPTAWAVARLSGAKAWLHIQDFEVDAAFSLGLLRGEWLRRLVVRAEGWLMRRFDVVSTISQGMRERVLAKGVAASRAKLAPNWVDVAQFDKPAPEAVAALRQELQVPEGALVALYSGNMAGKQGLEVLADLARMYLTKVPTLHPEVVFVFCGNGFGRADLEQRCQGLPNVRFINLQPAERLPVLLATADIHLLPQRAGAADLVMPSKLTGMLASARAVVATAHPGTELASVVQTCGMVVPPEDSPALALAVGTLAQDTALRRRLGEAGHTYAMARMDRHAVLQQFEDDALDLLSPKQHTAESPKGLGANLMMKLSRQTQKLYQRRKGDRS